MTKNEKIIAIVGAIGILEIKLEELKEYGDSEKILRSRINGLERLLKEIEAEED